MEAFSCRACNGEVRAYRAAVGLDFVLSRDGLPIAWRIAGAKWKYNADEAAHIVLKFGEREEAVPQWARVYEDLHP